MSLERGLAFETGVFLFYRKGKSETNRWEKERKAEKQSGATTVVINFLQLGFA